MPTTLPLPHDTAARDSLVARYVLIGGALGLLVALAVTFVLALIDGNAQGMTAGSCAIYGCTITMLLSQPTGIAGMLFGATAGGLVGAAAARRRRATK
jgi:hypothetical protein